MFGRLLSITLLSVPSLWATENPLDLMETAPGLATWTIQGTMTQGFVKDDLPEQMISAQTLGLTFKNAYADTQIPAPSYDLSDYHESYLPPQELRDAWDAVYRDNHHVVAHGFSARRLTQIFDAYFSDMGGVAPKDLTASQVMMLAPFATLELRNIISGCLIDLRKSNQNLLACYDVGFLYKVPKECIYAYGDTDIMSPSEGESPVQAIRATIESHPPTKFPHEDLLDMLSPSQRAVYEREWNIPRSDHQIRSTHYRAVTDVFPDLCKTQPALKNLTKKFSYKWDPMTPQRLVAAAAQSDASYNEVAFVPRVSNPDQEARIVGVYYTSHLQGFGAAEPRRNLSGNRDPLSKEDTISALHMLAQTMGVPLVALN